MAHYLICDLCGGIENPDALTPIHMKRKGQLFTFFFHNRHKDDCLGRKLSDMKVIFDAFGQNQLEVAAYLGGD